MIGGSNLLKHAAERWEGGEPMEAGRLIYENLPNDVRPGWAARILRLVLAHSGINDRPWWRRLLDYASGGVPFPSQAVGHVLQIADTPSDWTKAHRAFSAVRDEALRFEELQRRGCLTEQQSLYQRVLLLAELVAKVTYNASHPIDPFDEDSGWWIASELRVFVDQYWPTDEAFGEAAWKALTSRDA